MKKTYLKPTAQVVMLRYRHQLLADSLHSISTDLPSEDAVLINTEEVGSGFWGR